MVGFHGQIFFMFRYQWYKVLKICNIVFLFWWLICDLCTFCQLLVLRIEKKAFLEILFYDTYWTGRISSSGDFRPLGYGVSCHGCHLSGAWLFIRFHLSMLFGPGINSEILPICSFPFNFILSYGLQFANFSWFVSKYIRFEI